MRPFRQVTPEGLPNNPGPDMPDPAIILTRPKAQAAGFAEKLRQELGFEGEICLSPLIAIEPVGEAPVLDGVGGLIFTSKHGVDRFCALSESRDLPCWCVGDATARAADRAGMQARAAEGDASSLIRRILADAPKGPLLHLRGEQARGEVAPNLANAGLEAREQVLYRQVPCALSDRAKTLLQRENPVILPLFSPNTAVQFKSQGPFTAPLFLAAISQNVARELDGVAARQLVVAGRPDAGAMVKATDALIAAARSIESGTGAH